MLQLKLDAYRKVEKHNSSLDKLLEWRVSWIRRLFVQVMEHKTVLFAQHVVQVAERFHAAELLVAIQPK